MLITKHRDPRKPRSVAATHMSYFVLISQIREYLQSYVEGRVKLKCSQPKKITKKKDNSNLDSLYLFGQLHSTPKN